MKANTNYYIKARLFPAILTSIPVLVFYNIYVAETYNDDLTNIFSALPIITNTLLSSAILFLMVQINRLISKEVFQKIYFKDELEMPTTNYLLKSNTYFPPLVKRQIEDKSLSLFEIQLLSETEERADEFAAKKIIVIVVSQIRNMLRENSMLLQHNIEYGFFRNLIGGSLISFVFSVVMLIVAIFQDDDVIRNLSIAFAIFYIVPLLLSKVIIDKYGKYYAKILFEQFLSIRN